MSRARDLAGSNTALSVDGTVKLDGNYPTNTGNVALGDTALDSLDAGNYNTAVGHNALTANTDGSNTAYGAFSLEAVTTGGNNVAVGREALKGATGDNNTAVGYQAGTSSSSASFNTFIGRNAGTSTTSGENTFVGSSAGNAVTTGAKNTIIGKYDGNAGGLDIRTSSNNIVLADGDGNPRMYISDSGAASLNTVTNSDDYSLYLGIPPDNGTGTTPAACLWTQCSTNSGDSHKSAQFVYTHGYYDANFGHRGIIVRNYDNNTSRVARAMYLLNSSGANVGSIAFNDNGTSFNTSSDYRLKENIVELTDGIERVKQLVPKRFNFIADEDNKVVDGFIAHEVSDIVPEAVSGTKDEIMRQENGDPLLDNEGNEQPIYQGIDQAKLVPVLTKALQEAITKIETLETANADMLARIEALEAV